MTRHKEKVAIKRTGLEITRLGLGTAPLGDLFNSVKEDDSDELISTAFETGINFFDTAPLYGHGRAEIRLGRGLAATSKPFVLSTKVGWALKPIEETASSHFIDAVTTLEPVHDYSIEAIKSSIEQSLERLGVDHIDIALIHDAEDNVATAVNKVFPVLAELRSQGIINAVGMGMNFCAPSIEIMKDTDLDIALIAGRYTLLDQEAQNELFPLALKKNVSIIIGGVYNSGVLANPNPGATYDYLPASDEIIARARKIGAFLAERNVSLTAAALQFPLRHLAVTTVLTGIRSKAELLANIDDFDAQLPANIWADLEASGLIQGLIL